MTQTYDITSVYTRPASQARLAATPMDIPVDSCGICCFAKLPSSQSLHPCAPVINFSHYSARPHHALFWGFAKCFIAASLLNIAANGTPGPYTLLFGWLELVWAMGFFFWCKTVGFTAVKSQIKSKMGTVGTPTRKSERTRSKKE